MTGKSYAGKFCDPHTSKAARAAKRAEVEKLIADGWTDVRIAARTGMSWIQVAQVRKGYSVRNNVTMHGYDG